MVGATCVSTVVARALQVFLTCLANTFLPDEGGAGVRGVKWGSLAFEHNFSNLELHLLLRFTGRAAFILLRRSGDVCQSPGRQRSCAVELHTPPEWETPANLVPMTG